MIAKKKMLVFVIGFAFAFILALFSIIRRDTGSATESPPPSVTFALNDPAVIQQAGVFQNMSGSTSATLWKVPTSNPLHPTTLPDFTLSITQQFRVNIYSVSSEETPAEEAMRRASNQKYDLIYRPTIF